MDINGVVTGDFSSLEGTWKNSKGYMIFITAEGKVTYSHTQDRLILVISV